MINSMGIILTGGINEKLKQLTELRSSSAIPVGGKYRAIDFVLSNMVNSGIDKIGVFTQYNFRSLMDHLGSGKEWDLDRRNDGLFIFPPVFSGNNSGWYKGSADAMYSNIEFLKRSYEEYVVISQGNCVYKMLFDDMFEAHKSTNADITIAYREMFDFTREEVSLMGQISVDDNGKVTDMQEKPLQPKGVSCSMGIYLLKRELLIALLEESIAKGNYDFVKDILIKKIDTLNIYGYKYSGYWRNLSTPNLYYRCNMEFLNSEIRKQLFEQNGKVYTKVKDEPPAKYNEEAYVKNSIVADGCIIEGSVENSVLFRGVTVKKGAVIKDSIIMQSAVVNENSNLQYVIIDKNVIIGNDVALKGAVKLPIIVGKGIRV